MTEESLFLAALEKPTPAERQAFLEEACGQDVALRARVQLLLEADARSRGILERRAAPAGGTVDYTPSATAGQIIAGRYKLLEEIGEGGMGTVWVAEQTEPVKRKVALKLIKPGMDSRAVLARFEAERQALALMDHPNIAKVLDGGVTGGEPGGVSPGRPFFVMEYFKGVPITEYCDAARLSVPDRLHLFSQVCSAVQHAHQKGIIHRDLKPSNILVAPYDDRPVPKVIDFGLAKAMHQALTERTLHTAHETVLGTPLYMSPEQAQLNNLDVDTRSDIYSLGVLLYELLTGTTPVEKKRFKEAAWDEVRRIIREEEPPRPSARLSSTATLPSLAACRQTEPAYLTKLMRGELDWIAMKALEKDRTRRYETANALSRDIQRYLADEVVEARPPSVRYRVGKFVHRHKGQVFAASLVLLALVGGFVGTLLGLFEARRQEKEATRQEQIARNETGKKEKALRAEAERVKERDAALGKAKRALSREAQRVKERDNALRKEAAALDEANYRLDRSNFLLAVAAYDNRDVELARLRLDSIQPKHRGWEWHYLRRQATGGIFTLYGHTARVNSVAFSPDGTRIVTGSWDHTAKVWDARTGTPQLELKGHTNVVHSVAFSPDGRRIVTGSYDQTAKVWDARTGTPQLELKGHTSRVTSVAFSPDGTHIVTGSFTTKVWDARSGRLQLELKGGGVDSVAFSPDSTRIVTGGSDGTAKLWDARTGTPQLDLKRYMGGVNSVAFSPDGARIVIGSNNATAIVWDARTGTPQVELSGHPDVVRSVAFSPDGTRIVTGSRDQAKVWDARTGTPQLELWGHTGYVISVAFSPDGTRIVTGSWDQTAKVWDARTRTPQLELSGHTLGVSSVAFSPDGTRIVTGAGSSKNLSGEARVWDARTGRSLLELKGHTGYVSSVAFSPDGTRIVTGSGDGTAKVWDARTGTPQLELKGHTLGVSSVAFSPDGTRIVTGAGELLKHGGEAKVWDARTGTPQLELKGHTSWVYSVAFSPDGTRIATGSFDKTAKVWDARTGTLQLELKGGMVTTVAFSPDGTRIVTCSGQVARLWDARTGIPQLELKGHMHGVESMAFSPDGTRIVTGSFDKTAKVWDAGTGTPLLTLKGHTGPVNSVAFSSDGTRIVSGGFDQTAKVWDARVGTPLPPLKGHTDTVESVAFSPDGTRIISGGLDQTAKVWDARTGTPQLELKGHTGYVMSVAFSPNGTRIVTGSWDNTVKVWDARIGTPQLELKGHKYGVTSVAFSLDGTRIVTGSFLEKTAKVWDGQTGHELKGEPIPQTIANRCISPDGRFFAHPYGSLVELVLLQPDEEELAYRRLHTQPDLRRYRQGYEVARAAKDDFAARFYLKLLPPPEQKILTAQAAADREIAAGRTPDALGHLVIVSAAKPDDTHLALKLAALQAWFGQDKELAATCGRALETARGTFNLLKWWQLAHICCLRPTPDPSRREAALALARKAVEVAPNYLTLKLTLGMAEYRSGHFAQAEAALLAVAKGHGHFPQVAGTATFYRAMSLFRQGKVTEAKKLATEAAATMKPLPKDEKNPLAGGATPDDLTLWLAYKEAKALIQFTAAPRPEATRSQK
jgi:WD40 repeat protein/serine/threonine protein kinase